MDIDCTRRRRKQRQICTCKKFSFNFSSFFDACRGLLLLPQGCSSAARWCVVIVVYFCSSLVIGFHLLSAHHYIFIPLTLFTHSLLRYFMQTISDISNRVAYHNSNVQFIFILIGNINGTYQTIISLMIQCIIHLSSNNHLLNDSVYYASITKQSSLQ